MKAKKQFYWYACYLWALASLFYFYENSLTTSLSVMTDQLSYTFHIGHLELSLFSTAFFLAYAIMQLPTGILLDHYPVRYISVVAAMSCAIGCLVLCLTSTLWIGLLGRLMMGFGSAFAALTTFKIASEWFSSRQFTTLSGLMLTIGNLGGVAGQMTVHLLDDHPWQTIIISLGIIGASIAIINATTINESSSTKTERVSVSGITHDIKSILSIRNVWFMFFYGLFMYAPFLTLQSILGKPFIQHTLSATAKVSTHISTLMFFGFCLGAPTIGFISDKIGLRKPILVLSAIFTSTVLSLMLVERMQAPYIFSWLFFLFGFSISGFLPSFSVVKESIPKERVGTALGLMNTFNTIGGILVPPIIGYLINNQVESSNPYTYPLQVLPLCTFFAMLIAMLSKETHCRQVN